MGAGQVDEVGVQRWVLQAEVVCADIIARRGVSLGVRDAHSCGELRWLCWIADRW